MFIVLRLSSVAFCYRDGNDDIKDPQNELTPHQLEHRVFKTPTIIEMLSYSSGINGCVAGPFYEYKDYIDLINFEGRYKNMPSTVWPAARSFIKGLRSYIQLLFEYFIVYLVVYIVASPIVPL